MFAVNIELNLIAKKCAFLFCKYLCEHFLVHWPRLIFDDQGIYIDKRADKCYKIGKGYRKKIDTNRGMR